MNHRIHTYSYVYEYTYHTGMYTDAHTSMHPDECRYTHTSMTVKTYIHTYIQTHTHLIGVEKFAV